MCVRPLDWDTAFFGVPIARAAISTGLDVGAAVEAARNSGVACLYVYVPAADIHSVNEACAFGGCIVDFRIELAAYPEPGEPSGQTRPAESRDAEILEQLARALAEASRFRADPRFAAEKVAEMYVVWLRRCLSEGAVVVAKDGSSGFVGVLGDVAETRVELVYVAPGARGQGLAGALIADALLSRPAPCATVATQLGNVAAQKLYQAAGFRTLSTTVVLHLWLD
jgi:ribosomal protein S18 acetylase RimI-like enzyme